MATAPVIIPETNRPSRKPAMRVAGRCHFPDVFFEKEIDNSRLVREVDPARRRQCFVVLGVAALAFAFVFLYALQHFECVRYGYGIEQLKSQRAALTEWNQKLRLQQARLADPQRIDRLARQDLGLAPPQPQQVVRVHSMHRLEPSIPVVARNFATLAPASQGTARDP